MPILTQFVSNKTPISANSNRINCRLIWIISGIQTLRSIPHFSFPLVSNRLDGLDTLTYHIYARLEKGHSLWLKFSRFVTLKILCRRETLKDRTIPFLRSYLYEDERKRYSRMMINTFKLFWIFIFEGWHLTFSVYFATVPIHIIRKGHFNILCVNYKFRNKSWILKLMFWVVEFHASSVQAIKLKH